METIQVMELLGKQVRRNAKGFMELLKVLIEKEILTLDDMTRIQKVTYGADNQSPDQ